MACKALNVPYTDVVAMCAIDEGEAIEVPNEEWFRERRETRRTRAIAELLLTQISYKDEKARIPHQEYIMALIEGPKFDMRRLKPKKD